jgi:Redoxin.
MMSHPHPDHRIRKTHRGIVLFVFLLFSFGCVSSATKSSSNISPAKVSSPPEKKISLPIFEFSIPQNEWEKNYLGVSGSGNCKITQINTSVLIIEVFSMYCPHCQRSAPFVNDLFQTIQGRRDLKEQIKMIGIGVGNSPYEVDLFKNKYGIPFPLFPDQDGSISTMLGVSGTPTFIGAKINRDGTTERFYFTSGELTDAAIFLSELLNLSGMNLPAASCGVSQKLYKVHRHSPT